MPLARILTFDPGDAADFGRHLQELGFQVEIVNPNEQQLSPADLEVEFAICDQQQVLGRAAAIATQLEAEVVVFPGAIPPLPRPIPIPETAAYPAPADLPVHHHVEAAGIPVEPFGEIADHPREQPVDAVQIPAFGGQSDFIDPTKIERAPERQRTAVFAALMGSLAKTWQHCRSSFAKVLAVVMAATFSCGKFVAQYARSFQRQLALLLTRTRAAWQRHLAEMRQHRAEAAQQAAAHDLERQKQAELVAASHHQEQDALVASIGMSSESLQELERGHAEKQRLLAELEQLRAEVKEQPAIAERARRTMERITSLARPRRAERARSVPGRLRGAFAGAATAGLLLFVGMLLANFHSVIPLSHRLASGSVEEQVPFGAATVHGAPGVTVGGVTVGGPTVGGSVPGPQSARATGNSLPEPVPQAAAPQRRARAVHKPNSQWRRFHHRASSDEGDVTADDVVVKHFGPTRKTLQTAQQARLRRYSDE